MTATVFMGGSSRDDHRLRGTWQYSYVACLFCHSWRNTVKRSVSAMLMFIVVAALSTLAIASTLIALTNDGYRPVPTDRRRLP